MKSLRTLLAVAILLPLACACGESRTSAAATAPAAPKFADAWYTAGATTDLPIALNLHETAIGPAGRVVFADGRVFPAREIVQDATSLAFMVPAVDMTFSAAKAAGDTAWAGQVTVGDKTTAVTFSPGAAPDLSGRRFVTLAGGRQMNLICLGAGTPAVIFDAGAGSSTQSWKAVQPEIAKTAQACAYDRAGHGLSDPGPLPLDTAAVANDMEAMLKAAGITGPYVLVGHSLGSYHVRQFANTRFGQMAGMVLVDPSGDGQGPRFAKAIPKLGAIQEKIRNEQKALGCVAIMRAKLVPHSDPLFEKCGKSNDAELMEQTQSEVDAMEGASTEQLSESHRSYDDMPLIVLTRGDYVKGMPPEFTDADRAAMKKVWTEMHDEMTALSTAGVHREIPGAGHSIQADQPQAVIDAVNEVVTKARERVASK
jgi:pimeloyl-ACP methyl ester carboxylesterase